MCWCAVKKLLTLTAETLQESPVDQNAEDHTVHLSGCQHIALFSDYISCFWNSRSLTTDIAGTARRRRATAATVGYLSLLVLHHDNGHLPWSMGASAVYAINSLCFCCAMSGVGTDALLDLAACSLLHMLPGAGGSDAVADDDSAVPATGWVTSPALLYHRRDSDVDRLLASVLHVEWQQLEPRIDDCRSAQLVFVEHGAKLVIKKSEWNSLDMLFIYVNNRTHCQQCWNTL